MPRLIVTAQVENTKKWEEGFLSHGDLFRTMTQTLAYFCATDDNEIAIYEEVDDLEKYFEIIGQPQVAEAMASDGVKPDTVKVYVLDKEWHA